MKKSDILNNQSVKKIECPNLHQDLNVLLAELVGWKNLSIENDTVLVFQDNNSPQKFDLFDSKVIFPIAEKYSKKATQINETEWACEYISKDKSMLVFSEKEELALAMALVLEFCT